MYTLEGKVVIERLWEETLTELELRSVLHKQGLNDYSEVETCVLEPNGTFYVEAMKPSADERELAVLQTTIDSLMREVKAMRAELAAR